MKHFRFLPLLLISILVAGCETITQQDREVLRAHDVSRDVYDKMLYGDPLSLADVIQLSQRAVPPGLIIHYMDRIDMEYVLRKADVKQLRSAGVNEEVISYMLSTAPPYGPGGPVPYVGPLPYGGYPYGGLPFAGPYPYGGLTPYGYYGAGYEGPLIFVGGGYGFRGHRGWGRGGRDHGGDHHR